jgi:ubiquinol-cytochrome c reductase cytochrome c subunit
MPGRARQQRRRRLSSALVVLLALAAIGGLWTVAGPHSDVAKAAVSAEGNPQHGQALFNQGCATCHGLKAEGTKLAPSLVGVGAAAVDFQVGTGRMPLSRPGAQADRKPVRYDQDQIKDLAAYVVSLSPGDSGIDVPVVDIKSTGVDLTKGGDIFRTNCAQCHQAVGAGAPLTEGKYAPPLDQATPVQVVEAMRTGPENMPVFGSHQISDKDAISVAAYVRGVTHAKDPGGHGIGHYGPVPEGLVLWIVAIGGLLVACLWIGTRQQV